MIEVNIVREIKSPVSGGSRFVLEADGNYYVASSIPAAFDTGKPETLIFAGDAEGNITNHTDLAGGINVSVDEAIRMFRAVLNGEREYTIHDTPMMQNAGGDPLSAMLNTMFAMGNVPDDYYNDDEEDDDRG